MWSGLIVQTGLFCLSWRIPLRSVRLTKTLRQPRMITTRAFYACASSNHPYQPKCKELDQILTPSVNKVDLNFPPGSSRRGRNPQRMVALAHTLEFLNILKFNWVGIFRERVFSICNRFISTVLWNSLRGAKVFHRVRPMGLPRGSLHSCHEKGSRSLFGLPCIRETPPNGCLQLESHFSHKHGASAIISDGDWLSWHHNSTRMIINEMMVVGRKVDKVGGDMATLEATGPSSFNISRLESPLPLP